MSDDRSMWRRGDPTEPGNFAIWASVHGAPFSMHLVRIRLFDDTGRLVVSDTEGHHGVELDEYAARVVITHYRAIPFDRPE